MEHSEGADRYSERDMYPSPERLSGLPFQESKEREYQKQHPCKFSGYHGRSFSGKDAVCQSCDEQKDAIDSVETCNVSDPEMFLCQFCALQRCKHTEYQQQNRYERENFLQCVQNKSLRSCFLIELYMTNSCDYNCKKNICKDLII